MIVQCARCSKQVEYDPVEHLPPWCVHCGAELKDACPAGGTSAAKAAAAPAPSASNPLAGAGLIGGYLLFFFGLLATIISGFSFHGKGPVDEPQAFGPGMLLLGLTFAGLGSYFMARAAPITGPTISPGVAAGFMVCVIMTPLSAWVGLCIYYIGWCLRRWPGRPLPAIPLGLGVFLFALAGSWLWDGSLANERDLRGIGALLLIDLALAALVLSLVGFVARQRSSGVSD
jgi:hypothetical protein